MVPYVAVMLLGANGMKRLLKKRGVPAKKSAWILTGGIVVLSVAVMVGIMFFVIRAQRSGAFEENVEFYTVTENQSPFPEDWFEPQKAYHDELPLTVSDLRGGADEGYSLRKTVEESPLLGVENILQSPRMDADDRGEMHNLDYSIYRIKVPFLYDVCKNELLGRFDGIDPELVHAKYFAVDPMPWKAENAYETRLPEEFVGNHNTLYCCAIRIGLY